MFLIKQSSHSILLTEAVVRRCSVKKGFLRNFTKFTGKQLGQSLIFNKVAGLRPATLLKKRLWYRCFLVNFVKFLRTPFLQNTYRRLLLSIILRIRLPSTLFIHCKSLTVLLMMYYIFKRLLFNPFMTEADII